MFYYRLPKLGHEICPGGLWDNQGTQASSGNVFSAPVPGMTHAAPQIQGHFSLSGLQVIQPPQPQQQPRVGELRLNPSAQDFVPKSHSFFTTPTFGAPLGAPATTNPREVHPQQFQNTTPAATKTGHIALSNPLLQQQAQTNPRAPRENVSANARVPVNNNNLHAKLTQAATGNTNSNVNSNANTNSNKATLPVNRRANAQNRTGTDDSTDSTSEGRSGKSRDSRGLAANERKNTIFVKSLKYQVTKDHLANFFMENGCGAIQNIALPRSRKTGRSRRIAWVTFESDDGAERALSLNGATLMSKPLRICVAQNSKPEEEPAEPSPKRTVFARTLPSRSRTRLPLPSHIPAKNARMAQRLTPTKTKHPIGRRPAAGKPRNRRIGRGGGSDSRKL